MTPGPAPSRLHLGRTKAMLTREKLNDADWAVVRDTPHLVIIGISSTGGSPMDELLEHTAGMKSIVDAMNSTHPLIREIAVGANIMQAQKSTQSWYRSHRPGQSHAGRAAGKGARLDEGRHRRAARQGRTRRPAAVLGLRPVARHAGGTGGPRRATSSASAANWSAPASKSSSSGSRPSRSSGSRDLRVVATRRPPPIRPGAPPGRHGHIAAFSTSPLISFFFRLPTR